MQNNSTIFVKDLIFSGIHGSTGRETLDSQRFKLDIKIDLDISKASKSDLLKDTYDYKNAIQIARAVIEDEHHVLIERISSRIVEKICDNPMVFSAEIYMEKLDACKNGLPGITMQYKRFPQEDENKLLDFDIDLVLETLKNKNGISIPILSESYGKLLLEEALTYHYIEQPKIGGPFKVREELSSIKEFKPDSLFFRLKNDFQNVMARKLEKVGQYPFTQKLDFNEMSLQLYEKDSFGIGPHMDFSSCINLICVFVITGKAKFALCDDREKNNPTYLDSTPGNLMVFRAPGFMNSNLRPFHFLEDVTEKRIAFGLRQNIQLKQHE